MDKVVRLGTTAIGNNGASVSVFCRIQYKDGRLSITAVEGPLRSGNAVGSCGQILGHYDIKEIMSMRPAPGWDAEVISRFFQIWERWHLNDMRASSPAQRKKLYEVHGYYRHVPYNEAVKTLDSHGLLVDHGYYHNGKPYRFGSAWLSEPVPNDVIEFLENLPETDKNPAWV